MKQLRKSINYLIFIAIFYLMLAPLALARDYLVDEFKSMPGSLTLRQAIDAACQTSENDRIIFGKCGDKGKIINLKSPIESELTACKGSLTIDNTFTWDTCTNPDPELSVEPDSNNWTIASGQEEALLIISGSSKITTKGLNFKKSKGTAIIIQNSDDKTASQNTITGNTFQNNTLAIALDGDSDSKDNAIKTNSFDKPSVFISRSNATSNRSASAPSELYAWIESNKLHVQGNLSKSGEWLIEVYVEDPDKGLYVAKSSFAAMGIDIDKTWSSTLGLDKDDRLYVLAHYKSGDYYSTAPLSEAVSVDDEVPNFDADGDGHSSEENGGDDCNDNDAQIYPGKNESCDGKDNDCDDQVDDGVKTSYYQDKDGDTYGHSEWHTEACSPPTGFVTITGDCNDNNASIHPEATELCDGADNNCDGTVDNARTCIVDDFEVLEQSDADGDGYFVNSPITENDCDDANATVYPGAPELCDTLDNDCDDATDEDDACPEEDTDDDDDTPPEEEEETDDTPEEEEDSTPGDDDDDDELPPSDDDVDDEIDNTDDTEEPANAADDDEDGYVDSDWSGGIDCNDFDSRVHPHATDIPDNDIDEDCDGADAPAERSDNEDAPDSSGNELPPNGDEDELAPDNDIIIDDTSMLHGGAGCSLVIN